MIEQEGKKKCFEITKGFCRGDLLFFKRYKFPNGIQKHKYILILSKCINSKFYFYTLPTSQIGFYKNPHNNIDIIWVQEKKCKELPLKTVIDLKHIYTERASQFGENLYQGTLILKGKLSPEIIEVINRAIENAKTLNPKQKSLILDGVYEI